MGKEYWNSRAELEYEYRGERFYTITAIPYYYQRRKVIIKVLKDYLANKTAICDFGCGDGEYINILSKMYPEAHFHGVDISEKMIDVAKRRNRASHLTWEVSGNGIQATNQFDVVYSSACFAHISDDVMNVLLNNICEHLFGGGGGDLF